VKRSHVAREYSLHEEERLPVVEYWNRVSARCDLRFFFNGSKSKWQVNRLNAEDKNIIEETWLISSLEVMTFTYSTVDEKHRHCLGAFGTMHLGMNGEGKINV
jgi:hypothetical protein